MKRISAVLPFLILSFSFTSLNYSQVNIEWASFYNGPAAAGGANAIAVDNSGNVYVTGKSDGGASDYDIATVKYNSNGAEVWSVRYNGVQGDGWDEGFAIAADNAGNVYVCGTASESDSNYNFCTIKYNSAGAQQWVRIIDGSAHSDDFAFALTTDNSGNVYVTGYISPSSGGYNMCTVKYNSAGNPDWTIYYGGPASIRAIAFGIKLDGSGNVYVGGECQTISSASDYFVAKYSNGGTVQWIKFYSGIGNDFMHGFDIDNQGNTYITGESIQTLTYDYCTMKLKPNGDSVWVRRYNGPDNGSDQAYSVAADPFGNAIVTGVSFNPTATSSAMCTVKYDTAGVQKWVNRYNGTTGLSVSFAVVTDQTGNSYITGRDFSSCTIKYNPGGAQQWVINADSIGTGQSIATDSQNKVYITGDGTVIGATYGTIKFGQPIGIQKISTEIPADFSLLQNYPNPFNPTTKIRFTIPAPSPLERAGVRLVIYDVLGREAATLVNEQLQPGTYEVEWNASNFSSGVYYYKIESGSYSETKKMILIK